MKKLLLKAYYLIRLALLLPKSLIFYRWMKKEGGEIDRLLQSDALEEKMEGIRQHFTTPAYPELLVAVTTACVVGKWKYMWWYYRYDLTGLGDRFVEERNKFKPLRKDLN